MNWRPRFRIAHIFALTVLVAMTIGWLEYVKRDRAACAEMKSSGCYLLPGVDEHFESSHNPHDLSSSPWASAGLGDLSASSWNGSVAETWLPPGWKVQTILVEWASALSVAAKHREHLGTLESVKVARGLVTGEDLESLSNLLGYRSLQLSGCWGGSGYMSPAREPDEQAEIWRCLRLPARLERLELDACRMNEAALKELISPVMRLKVLRCHGMRIGDTFFDDPAVRAKLSELTNIDLRCTDVTDLTVQRLAEIPSLETINLYRTRVTDAGLAELERLPRLRMVNVNETYVSAEAFSAFRNRTPTVVLVVHRRESQPRGTPEHRFDYRPGHYPYEYVTEVGE